MVVPLTHLFLRKFSWLVTMLCHLNQNTRQFDCDIIFHSKWYHANDIKKCVNKINSLLAVGYVYHVSCHVLVFFFSSMWWERERVCWEIAAANVFWPNAKNQISRKSNRQIESNQIQSKHGNPTKSHTPKFIRAARVSFALFIYVVEVANCVFFLYHFYYLLVRFRHRLVFFFLHFYIVVAGFASEKPSQNIFPPGNDSAKWFQPISIRLSIEWNDDFCCGERQFFLLKC